MSESSDLRTLGDVNRQKASPYSLIQRPYNRLVRPVAFCLFGKRLTVVNGVIMRRQALTDFKRVLHCKSPMYSIIRDTVAPGDHIVDIAAGWGGFAVTAAKNGATVDSYEAARNMFVWAQETVRINEMGHRVMVHHAVVGDHTDGLFGSAESADAIGPNELPSMDGLVLDCEGAELDIIPGLIEPNRPEYVIVETHPEVDCPAPTDAVVEVLGDAGYDVSIELDMETEDKHAILAREVTAQ